MPSILKAVIGKKTQDIEDAIAQNGDPNEIGEDTFGRWLVTPAGMAVENCDVRTLRVLLDAGANPNGFSHERVFHIPGANDNSPVSLCALNSRRAKNRPHEKSRRMGILSLLTRHGVNPWEIVDTKTTTAADELLSKASLDEILAFFNLTHATRQASTTAYSSIIAAENINGIGVLQKNGINPNTCDARTCFAEALKTSNPEEIIRKMLDVGMSLEALVSLTAGENVPDEILQIVRRKREALRRIVNGFNADPRRNETKTAVISGNWRKIGELIERGADFGIDGLINVAIARGHIGMAKKLAEMGAPVTSSAWAGTLGQDFDTEILSSTPPMREIFLKNGKLDQNSPLAIAIAKNDPIAGKMIETLVASMPQGDRLDNIMGEVIEMAIKSGNSNVAEHVLALNFSPSPKMSFDAAPEATKRLAAKMDEQPVRRRIPTPGFG